MTGRGGRFIQPCKAPLLVGDGRRDDSNASSQTPHGSNPQQRWGASAAEWQHNSDTIGLTSDLLPVVSNPRAVKSPASSLKTLGKTPSRYNAHRHVVGFSRWTEHIATAADIEAWSAEPDYGICVQTRRIRGIDIDIEDQGKALEVAFCVLRSLATSAAKLPVRFRSNSGRLLIPIEVNGAARKSILRTSHGAIEFLADGQQFIAAGTHPSGERYQWAKLEELLDLRLSLLQ